MDFHSLNRRELQSLCKLNKIPANITNVAMADALQSLDIVVGIEDFLNVSKSETTANAAKSVEKVEVFSPKAPNTRCRTSTRQSVKKPTEAESFPATVTRTTRRGSKQQPPEVEESKAKNDLLKTPAITSTGKKTLRTASHRNVNVRLNECENEGAKEENKFSTRRSTRLTETKPRQKRGVNIDSFLDQVDDVKSKEPVEDEEKSIKTTEAVVIEEEASHEAGEEDVDCDKMNIQKPESEENKNPVKDGDLEVDLEISEVQKEVKPESDGMSIPCEEDDEDCTEEVFNKPTSDETNDTVSAGSGAKLGHEDTLNAAEVEMNNQVLEINEVEDICNAFENVVVMEEEASHKAGEDDLKILEEKNDMKPESDGMSSPCEEDEDDEEEVEDCDEEVNKLMQSSSDETNDSVSVGSDAKLGQEATLYSDLEMNNQDAELEMNNQVLDTNVDETETVVDNHSIISEEVEDMGPEFVTANNVNKFSDAESALVQSPLKPELFSENNVCDMSDVESGPAQSPLSMSDVTGYPTHEDLKPKLVTENNVNQDAELEMNNQVLDINVDETETVVDNHCIISEEVEDMGPEFLTANDVNKFSDSESARAQSPLKPELITKNNVCDMSDVESGPARNPLSFSDVTGEPTHVEDLMPELITENNVSDKSDAESGPAHPTHVEDLKPEPVTENTVHEFDAESGPAENPLMGHAAHVPAVKVFSDDKENNVDEGSYRKKENEDGSEKMKSLTEMSIRQLKKQLKALTLKTNNSKEECGATKRPALQTLCENQLVGGENEN